jgi:hypothetical protein
MTKLTLWGAGLAMLIVGLQHLFAPQMMMNTPMIDLTSVNHYHIIRAAYGGAYIGIAALFLVGAWRAEYVRTSLLAIACIFIGFAIGRVFSIVVDGVPVSLYLGVLAFEVVFATLAWRSLRAK